MNYNDYLEEAYNDLMAVKPEWAEVAEPQSAINIIAQILALYKPTIESVYTEMLNNCSIDTADLQHLIQGYGGIAKVYLKEATHTTYDIVIQAKEDDTLPAGFTISDSAGNTYELVNDTPIVAGENIVSFQAQETGAITSLKNTIININQPRGSILSVNNPNSPTYIGQEQESEESFRIRCKATQQQGIGATRNLTQALINDAGCSRALVIWNSENKIIHNWIRPHSYAILTYGGSDDKIAETIGKYRIIKDNSMNPETEKTQLLKVEGRLVEATGQYTAYSQLLVGWTPATIVQIYLKVVLTKDLPDTIISSLKQYIIDYIADQNLEDFESSFQYTTFIYVVNDFLVKNGYSSVAIKSCLLSTDNKTWKEELEPENIQDILTLLVSNISVEYGG